jgi:hypothetical protein
MITKMPLLSRWALPLVTVFALASCTATEADVPSEPVVVFPAWAVTHDQTQSVKVTAAAGWTVDRVEYSTDGINWAQAKPGTGDNYSVVLTNLDIGTTELTLRVTSSYRGQSEVNYYYSEIQNVAAVFGCATAASMLPSSTLYRANGTETRTMLGYFGDPSKGHTVTFDISFTDVNGNVFDTVGAIVNYGRDSITATFDVARATCDTGGNPPNTNPPHDCDVPYTLAVWVDGAVLCPATAFGQIHSYWDSGR